MPGVKRRSLMCPQRRTSATGAGGGSAAGRKLTKFDSLLAVELRAAIGRNAATAAVKSTLINGRVRPPPAIYA